MSTVSLVKETDFHVVTVGPVQVASGSGGSVAEIFIIDKYLASKNGTTSCKSVQNGALERKKIGL